MGKERDNGAYSDNGIQELNQISKGTGCERKEKAFEQTKELLLELPKRAFNSSSPDV